MKRRTTGYSRPEAHGEPRSEGSCELRIEFADPVQRERFVKEFGAGSRKFANWLEVFLERK